MREPREEDRRAEHVGWDEERVPPNPTQDMVGLVPRPTLQVRLITTTTTHNLAPLAPPRGEGLGVRGKPLPIFAPRKQIQADKKNDP